MKKPTLTFEEVLDIVEKFMINSSIRRYCTEICKGKCCMECYTNNPKSCRHCEDRRLTCSIYTCWEFFVANIYFEPANKTFVEKTRFPISIKGNLEEINIKEVRKTMTNLIMMGIVVYDL
jgi:hypothetical protein